MEPIMISMALLILAALAIAVSLVISRALPWVGLALSPFLSAAVSLCLLKGIGPYLSEGESGYTTFCAAMIGALNLLLAMLMFVTAKGAQGRPNVAYAIAKGFLIAAIVLVGLVSSFVLTGPLGVLGVLVICFLMIRLALISRDAWVTHLFTTMGVAIRQSLPLPETLAIEAGALGGKPRRILSEISYALTQGLPLSEAIRKGYWGCPGFALAQIETAEKIHQLPQAIANIEAGLRRQAQDSRRTMPANPMYPPIVILFALVAIGFLSKLIFPSFRVILADMGIPMPQLTSWFYSTFGPTMTPMPWGAELAILLLAIILVVALTLYAVLMPRRPRDPRLLSIIGDAVKWRLPWVRWFELNQALLQTVSFLRMSLTSGTAVDLAIGQAAELDTNLCYRRRLRKWLRRVQGGQEISLAAAESGVGKSLQWAFDQKANPGQTLAVLEMLESSYKAAYNYRARMVRFVAWPFVTISLAVLVGTVVMSAFLPMISLLQFTMKDIIP